MPERPTEFLTEFRVLDIAEGEITRLLELAQDFVVYSATLKDTICAPQGFRFDGESIPVWLHWLVPPFGQSRRGACIHDYLYQYHGYLSQETGQLVPVTRKQADNVYRELVLAKGLPRWRATMRYTVLRLVGWRAWKKTRK